MKIRILIASVAFCAAMIAARAADQTPAASPVLQELQTLVAKVKTKLSSGARTEAALADELKGFDTLLAAHRDEKTEEVAQVLMMKAALYVQVFEDFDKGSALLRQVKSDFPGTQAARGAEQVLAKLDEQKDALKMQSTLKPGAAFPDFAEKDLAGAPLSLGQYKGKVVLVDFWATWCGPCVAELPNVIAAYGKYHAKGFEIVGISLDQSGDALKKFIKEKGMTWPQYFDGAGWDNKLSKRYGVNSIPATYLLDRDGRIVAKGLRGPALDTELARLLKE